MVERPDVGVAAASQVAAFGEAEGQTAVTSTAQGDAIEAERIV